MEFADTIEWNLADCLDTIAGLRGQRPAIIQGDAVISWRRFRRHAESIAAWLDQAGLRPQSTVALCSYNDIAYLETVYACLRAGMTPVNVNYRYQREALRHLLQDCDAEAILIHEDLVDTLGEILPELPRLKAVIVIGTAQAPGPLDSVVHANIATIVALGGRQPDYNRSGNDRVLVYSNGTTGVSGGVMWRQRDLYYFLAGGTVGPAPDTAETFYRFILDDVEPLCVLVVTPLMRATAFFAALTVLLTGGTVILSSSPEPLDPADVLELIRQHEPNALSIGGDELVESILEALAPLEVIFCSDVPWSQDLRARLKGRHSGIRLMDQLARMPMPR